MATKYLQIAGTLLCRRPLRPPHCRRYAKQHERACRLFNDCLVKSLLKPTLSRSKATPYCANRVLSLLSKVMNLAVQPERMRPDNPAKGVARFHEERRERWLSTDELRRLVATWVWRSSRPTISSDSPDETKVRGVGVPEIVQPHDEALRPPRRQPLREATERFGAMVGSPRLR
jgi:hypothetical protein